MTVAQYACAALVHDDTHQGRSQELAIHGTKDGVWGMGSPPAGSRGRAPLGVWGRSPQKPKTNFPGTTGGHARM